MFWTQDQGSKLMRLEVFMKLPKADGAGLLKDDLAAFGFIPGAMPETGLPIGFAIHQEQNQPWVGLTCSACHTTQWNSGGHKVIVEGAPSMLDFDSFFKATVLAVRAACDDRARFDAMGQSAVTYQDFCVGPASLRSKLDARLRINATPVEAGFGRVDAFGQIFNQISVGVLKNSEAYAKPPVAPTSYPCLWDISQLKAVQWNGSAPNLGVNGVGAKLRNVGELLGVFGEVEFKPGNKFVPQFPSSVNGDGLTKIEKWVSQLYSPAWPPTFAPIDEAARDRGKELYAGKANCKGCHMVLNPKSDRSHVEANVYPVDNVRTEDIMVNQFRLDKVPSGPLAGKIKLVVPRRPLAKFESVDLISDLTSYVTLGALEGSGDNYAPSRVEMLSATAQVTWQGQPNLNAYKARPLNGIWATAPYLHNGSIPNLSELLKREKERVTSFCTGTREFDPVNVGYSASPCSGPGFLFDTTRIGNGNFGHEYGIDLSTAEKKDLIEYLKSL